MKLAVTGGAGFLGYHCCNELAEKFDEIRVIDIAPLEAAEYPEQVQYVAGDVRDEAAMRSALSGCEALIHAAAALPLWKRADIFSTNVEGTRAVMAAALANEVARVVEISSTAVYGVPKKHPIYEKDPLVGVGAYGEAKIAAEKVCDEFRERGLCICTLRPKTFIGTGRMGVFQILYDWVESGKKIPIIGDGTNRYQLLEVEDLVRAIYLGLTKPAEQANDVFNVGATEFGTVAEDVGALCDYAGSGARVMRTKAWVVKPLLELAWVLKVSPLYKWVYGTADTDSFVATEKIEEVLGWEPEYSNAQALIRSYEWYLEHKGEISGAEGVTHRVAWKQGVLGIVKRFM
jgi:nucleoside-diphosphate-sugar epimerase